MPEREPFHHREEGGSSGQQTPAHNSDTHDARLGRDGECRKNKWIYFVPPDMLDLPAIKNPAASKAWIKAGTQEILWVGMSTRK